MSTYVMSFGVFMKITNGPVDYEELSEKLYEAGSIWNLNYDGTLVFSDEGGEDIYGILFASTNSVKAEDIELLNKLGIEVDATNVKPYVCVWYNGADSDMSMFTLEEFEKQNEK